MEFCEVGLAPAFRFLWPAGRKPWMPGQDTGMTGTRQRSDDSATSMLSRFLTVGGLTLLSRITGFVRDIMLAAILGAGPIADAFFVALKLPNHFRAIFAEGAFNAAFVPAYARVRGQGGPADAALFANRIFMLLLGVELVLVVLALA